MDILFHSPVMLARRFATLDVLSEGRAIAGLGIGWSKDEYQASNIPFKDKGERANEFLQALKRIWTDDVVEFKGKYYNIPPSKIVIDIYSYDSKEPICSTNLTIRGSWLLPTGKQLKQDAVINTAVIPNIIVIHCSFKFIAAAIVWIHLSSLLVVDYCSRPRPPYL